MHRQSSIRLVQIASVFSLTLTLTVNALSTTIPLHGRTAGQIIARYNNLLVPDRMVFIIWALIYLLLVLYISKVQMHLHQQTAEQQAVLTRQGWLFTFSGILNCAWLLAWHFFQLQLSLGLMLALLTVLMMIYTDIPMEIPFRERWLLRLPFSLYTAWISFAMVVNTAALLVGNGWTGAPFGQTFWALLALAGLTLLGWVALNRRHDIGFALTLAWGITGVLIQHLTILKKAWPLIIFGSAAALALLAAGIVFTLIRICMTRSRPQSKL